MKLLDLPLYAFLADATSKDNLFMSVLHVEDNGSTLVTTDGRRCHIVTGDLPQLENGDYELTKGKKEWLAEKVDHGQFLDYTRIIPDYKDAGYIVNRSRCQLSDLAYVVSKYDAAIDITFFKPLVKLDLSWTIRGKGNVYSISFKADNGAFHYHAIIMPYKCDSVRPEVPNA